MTFREAAFLYWTYACTWDGFPSTSKLVTFSPDNPWLRAYNALMLEAGLQIAPLVSGGADLVHQGLGTADSYA